jgi:tight adherence protein B
MLISFLVFLFGLFLVLGAYLIATRGSDSKRRRLQKRLADALLHSAHTEDVEVILARNELMSEIPFVNRFLVQLQAALHLKRMLDQADIQITPSRMVMFSVMAGMLGLLAASALTISVLIIAASGLVAAMIPFVHVWWKRRQRFNACLEHLPDALDLMSRGLSAGHAFSESLHMVASEMPEPIATEFRKTYEEQNLGLSLKLALENMIDRVPLLDLKMVVTAVLIQRETGGNLAEILENLSQVIRERQSMYLKVRALSSEGRMTAIMLTVLPIFAFVTLFLLNPPFFLDVANDPWFVPGFLMLIILYLVGFFTIRKMVDLKV